MPGRIGLPEQRPVGVAVEEHAAQAQRVAHGVEIVGRLGRRVGGIARAELVGALADGDVLLDQALLQAGAVDRTGAAGSASVDVDQVAAT